MRKIGIVNFMSKCEGGGINVVGHMRTGQLWILSDPDLFCWIGNSSPDTVPISESYPSFVNLYEKVVGTV